MAPTPNLAALEAAFSHQHSELSRIKQALSGLDSDLALDVSPRWLLELAEACEVDTPRQPRPLAHGLRG